MSKSERVARTSPDLVAEQIARLREAFPEAVAEGRVDWDRLRETLGEIVDDRPERYQFTWAGKQDAIRLLQVPSRATLVPCPEESIGWDTTHNVFIEGENLEVLKLLYKAYFGRVKMVYIDPPYNTGNDFVYPDDYADPLDTYLRLTGQRDAAGNLLTSNPETSGRYHSSWLSMMYPRLFLARQLLREDGMVFVSIDDKEIANLRLLMNEVFGEENFVESFVWKKSYGGGAKERHAVTQHEYVVLYCRNLEGMGELWLPPDPETEKRYYKDRDEKFETRGPYRLKPLEATASMDRRQNLDFPIPLPWGGEVRPKRQWWWGRRRVAKALANGDLDFAQDGTEVTVSYKQYLRAEDGTTRGAKPFSVIDGIYTQHGTSDLKDDFDGRLVMQFPKPAALIGRLLDIGSDPDTGQVIVDFFAGSCTTARAVLELNRRDFGDRRFIMVQLPEPLPSPEGGLATIADIGKERIRRVIARMQSGNTEKLDLQARDTPEDLGFRVLKLAESSFRQWEPPDTDDPETIAARTELFHDPLLEGWTAERVIAEVALKEAGYGLDYTVVQRDLNGNVIWEVTDPGKEQTLRLCLDETLSPDSVRALGLGKEDLFICRDVALDDSLAANLALQCRLRVIQAMRFRFDANQPYQARAIESVVALFDGQPRIEAQLTISASGGFSAVANRLDLGEGELLQNLQTTQAASNLLPDTALQYLGGTAPTAGGEVPVQFANFSVEMETGTGKTYVYLRTILELFRAYGLRKFVVVVPSIAVREGVLKTLAITAPHLRELYGNLPYRYQVYDSANLAQVRHFAGSDAVEILVMTIDSFNRASNVIRQSTDRLQGETPIHLLQATRPVLVLDEPQNMESELRIRALAALDPLLALRYSATHRNPYNVVYRLTPYDAYQQGLVKKIEVGSVVQSDDENLPFLRLEGISSVKNTVTARITVHRRMADETVRAHAVTVRAGDKLEDKAGRAQYASYVVDEISPAGRFVRFASGDEIRVGETQGTDKEAIFAAQIHETVKTHFEKQHRLQRQGIKVLSLFFIDRVDNYAPPNSLLRRLFRESFDELKAGYPEWRHLDAEAVQAAYFAERRTRAGEVVREDTSGKTQRDQQAYELIMRNKEQLLSFEEPVCFIFSHSALREGWDSPNVFQICTLNQTGSEMRKRQEVGRGIRLAVNQQGERVRDDAVNLLSVIANESFDRYVADLQTEIETEYGQEGVPPSPKRKGSPKAKLRKRRALSEEFRELWERISQKTRYSVRIDTPRLLAEVVEEIDRSHIPAPRITMTKAQMEVREDTRAFGAVQTTATRTVLELDRRHEMPNLVALMDDLLRRSDPPVRLTRRTLLEVFRRTSQQEAALRNPYGFASEAVRILRARLADHLVNGIEYEKTGEWYDLRQILDEKEVEVFGRFIVHARSPRSIYDHIACDSAVESKFVEDLERREDVLVYVKLPRWFTVQTPVGEYNPDWAIVMRHPNEGKPIVYLVRETKDTRNLNELRPDERRKVKCGEKHFRGALGVDYRVVTSASELPGIQDS